MSLCWRKQREGYELKEVGRDSWGLEEISVRHAKLKIDHGDTKPSCEQERCRALQDTVYL